MSIVNSGSKGGYATLYFRNGLPADALWHYPGNLQNGDETVTGFRISSVFWSCDSASTTTPGHATISRGSNTLLLLSGTGEHDFQSKGMQIESDPTANISCSFSFTTGHVIVKVKKIADYVSSTDSPTL